MSLLSCFELASAFCKFKKDHINGQKEKEFHIAVKLPFAFSPHITYPE